VTSQKQFEHGLFWVCWFEVVFFFNFSMTGTYLILSQENKLKKVTWWYYYYYYFLNFLVLCLLYPIKQLWQIWFGFLDVVSAAHKRYFLGTPLLRALHDRSYLLVAVNRGKSSSEGVRREI
jgi:hypothetical protein